MTINLEVLLPLLAVVLPLLAGLVTWSLNERSKRLAEEYRRKEERYRELVSRIRAFSVQANDPVRRSEFLDELNLAWMYCSDDVIRRAYAFLNSVHVDAPRSVAKTEQAKETILGELMVAIRQDLIRRDPLKASELTAADFQLLGAR